MTKDKKRRKRKPRERIKKERIKKETIYILIALLVVIFGAIFLYKTTKTIIIIEKEESVEINLCQYKEATFSDSFSGDGWIDVEKTTLVFKKDEMIFVYPENPNLTASLSKPEELEEQTKRAVSVGVNFAVNEVVAAQITKSENKIINGKIKYYFSNDGGLRWEPAEIGRITYFKNQGNELKWKAEIGPLDERESYSPSGSFIGSMYIKYWYQR